MSILEWIIYSICFVLFWIIAFIFLYLIGKWIFLAIDKLFHKEDEE